MDKTLEICKISEALPETLGLTDGSYDIFDGRALFTEQTTTTNSSAYGTLELPISFASNIRGPTVLFVEQHERSNVTKM